MCIQPNAIRTGSNKDNLNRVNHCCIIESRLSIIFFFIIFLLPFASQAEDSVAVSSEFTLTMGGDQNYYPFTYLDSKNNPAGFDVALMKAVAKEMGFNVKFQLGKWTEVINQFNEGAIDVVPMFVSQSRLERYDFTSAYANRDHVLFGGNISSFISSQEELNGEKILVQEGSLASEWVEESGLIDNIVIMKNNVDMLRQAASASDTYMLGARIQTQHLIKQHDIKGVGVKSSPILSNNYAYATLDKNDDIHTLLAKGVAILHENGEFEKLYKEFEYDLNATPYWKKLLLPAKLFLLILFISYIAYKFKQQLKTTAINLKHEAEQKVIAQKKAFYLTNHEQITGLPNRKYVLEILNKLISKNESSNEIGLLYISINGLVHIYRNAGFEIGDKLLTDVARRLTDNKDIVVVAPNSGHFAVILTNENTNNDILGYSREILNSIEDRYDIDKVGLDIQCNAGLAFFPEHCETPERLLRNAELANAITARESITNLQVYSDKFEPDKRSLQLLADFRDALRDDQFVLFYQPKHSLITGKLYGAEVLVRWQHPELGFLPPGVFIPLLEQTGLIKDLSSHILMKTMQKSQEWRDANCILSVNVSAKDISDRNFTNTTLKLIESIENNIMMELTETAFATNSREFSENINSLKEKNINISIDDYGVGFSSMQYLRDLKPYELKIDRTFIANVLMAKENDVLVKSTVDMAHTLGITVVAEGAEDMQTILHLKKLGCDIVQGYGVAKPMDEASFEQWMEKPGFALQSKIKAFPT